MLVWDKRFIDLLHAVNVFVGPPEEAADVEATAVECIVAGAMAVGLIAVGVMAVVETVGAGIVAVNAASAVESMHLSESRDAIQAFDLVG